MTKKNKDGIKKHSPHQTETEPSIISQIPKEHMQDAILELVEIAKRNRAKAQQEQQELQFKPMDQESYQDVARVDPPNGLLSQVPSRDDPVEDMTDPTVQRMLKRGIPLTRENWIDLAWPEMPAEWTAEHEEEIPDFLRESSENSSTTSDRGTITTGAFYQQIKNLTEDFTKSLEEGNTMEESEYLEKTNDREFEVCYGDLLDGLSIDIVKYSEIEPLSDDQYDKLWSEMTDIRLVEMCDNCELIETGEHDAPGASTIYYSLITTNEEAFKSELREAIKSIISA